MNWRDGDRTSRFYAGTVTDDFFSTLDIPFLLGRGIAPGETNTAVLSYRVWRGTFAADPGILGRKLILEGRVYTVAGVLPADHRSVVGYGIAPDIYIPVTNPDERVQFYARMPKGMTRAMARARLLSLFAQLDRIHPKEGWQRTRQMRITGVTGLDLLRQMLPGAVVAFFAMLLIVVRAGDADRVHERSEPAFGARLQPLAGTGHSSVARRQPQADRASPAGRELIARGAGRGRGIGDRHRLRQGDQQPRSAGAYPVSSGGLARWRLLWYSLGIVLVSALVCGLLPALKAVRKDVSRALKQEERQTARAWNLRSVLVAGQLAVSIVLLTTGFLFVHNLLRATSMDPGFDVRHTIWAYMRLVPDQYNDPSQAKQTAVVSSALERLRALPGCRIGCHRPARSIKRQLRDRGPSSNGLVQHSNRRRVRMQQRRAGLLSHDRHSDSAWTGVYLGRP